MCTDLCGTRGYMSPELLNMQPYALPNDIWAFAALLYSLASSERPFPVINNEQITIENISVFAKLIENTELTFDGPNWESHSDNFKNLLASMLNKNPSKRLVINQILDHPWFEQNDSSGERPQSSNIN